MTRARTASTLARRLTTSASLAACLAAFASQAAAAPPEQESPKRALPDYRGRPGPGTTPGDVLLLLPRAVFFPLYLVSEYLLRRPLGALTRAAERGHWIEALTDVFTFGPNHNIGIVPTGLVDTGFRPSIGVYAFYDDFLVPKNQLRLHASFGGIDWLRLTVADRIPMGERAKLKLRFETAHRPDYVFYGLGPRTLARARGRYGSDYLDGGASLEARPGKGWFAETHAGVRAVRFRDVTCCTDPSVVQVATVQQTPLPPGFASGYTGLRAGITLAYDTRHPRPAPGSGARLEGVAEYGADLREPHASGWLRYGGTVGGFLDLTGQNRVLSLAATALFADPLGEREIPFTELVSLGGGGQMSGFYQGRLTGRSAGVVALEYRYPIWAFFDASAQVAVGNVFDAHLIGLRPENLRLSFSFGIRTSGDRDHSFNVLVGGGTETFGQGGHLSEARLLIGATQGF